MTAFTTSVQRWQQTGAIGVLSSEELHAAGVSPAMRVAHLRARRWQRIGMATVLHNHVLTRVEREPALVVAAGSVPSPRTACGLLAAAVQQRLTTAAMIGAALALQPKLRHFRALRLALHDIEQGAQALSEIDFVALCRRHKLPAPVQQGVRIEGSGRRRYLDAQWRRRDGGLLVVEVDGAIHLQPLTWVDDQLRQNEVVLGGAAVLRFPSTVIRSDERTVADQLRRGLQWR